MHTKKYNEIREFKKEELTESLLYSIDTGETTAFDTCMMTSQRRLLSILNGKAFWSRKKRINTHIFRHNWAKNKYKELGTADAVRLAMGEKRLSSAQGYIFSEIRFE